VDVTLSPLTDAERAWITAQLGGAERFLADYGSNRHTGGLDAYDHAWAAWLDRQSVDPEDPNSVINAVGVLFGQTLVDELEEFEWMIATDESGTDLAVFGLPGQGDVLIFPANLVAKRYETREVQFLQRVRDEIGARVEQLRAES
jgi:hypothetical protein